jgi:GNAT superfamily N-acetyltransferase
MHIRSARLTDAPAIARVHVQSWQAAYRDVVPGEYLDTLDAEKREPLWRESISRGTPEIWVAEVQSRVVGWSAFGMSRDPDAQSHTGELEAIYLLQDYWHTGTGWALWLVSRRRLVERGFSVVTLWTLADNLRASRFYAAAGFTPDPGSAVEVTLGNKSLRKVRYKANLREIATDHV